MNPSAPLLADDIFATEEKLLGALVSVRNSALKTEEKAAIRDLILDYAGTTDEAHRAKLKNEITQKLAPITPSNKPTTASDTPTPDKANTVPPAAVTRHARPVPVFTDIASALPKQSAESETVLTPIVNETPKTAPTEPVQPVEIKKTAPSVLNTPPKTAPIEPAKIAAVSDPQTKASEVSIKKEIPTAPINTNLRDRINEIKHDINQKVGNPVNLISTDEVIGREYMSALLNAMKSVSSGEGGGKEALTRLEEVYKKVNELLAKGNIPKKEETKPVASAPTVVKEITASIATPSKSTDKPVTRNSSLVASLIQKDKAVDKIVSKLQPTGPATKPVNQSEQHKLFVKTTETKKPEVATQPQKLTPVSTVTALPEQIETLRKKSIDQENEAKKPITDLQSERVTAGLKQLLSEWKLFRGNGWFGIGPTGMDHPLYKTIANLSMAAVVAGRFEGATPEVKQTIADYMNGWHYEQGIVHDMGESFEHYLRRVILHILGHQRDLRQPDPEKKT